MTNAKSSLIIIYVACESSRQSDAEVAELADAHGSGPCGRNTLWFDSHLLHSRETHDEIHVSFLFSKPFRARRRASEKLQIVVGQEQMSRYIHPFHISPPSINTGQNTRLPIIKKRNRAQKSLGTPSYPFEDPGGSSHSQGIDCHSAYFPKSGCPQTASQQVRRPEAAARDRGAARAARRQTRRLSGARG